MYNALAINAARRHAYLTYRRTVGGGQLSANKQTVND